jgi:copper chaperone
VIKNIHEEKTMNESIILNVTGMKCGGCEAAVTGKLMALDGVVAVKASSQDQQVAVDFDAEKLPLAAIKQAVADAGYTVEG